MKTESAAPARSARWFLLRLPESDGDFRQLGLRRHAQDVRRTGADDLKCHRLRRCHGAAAAVKITGKEVKETFADIKLAAIQPLADNKESERRLATCNADVVAFR